MLIRRKLQQARRGVAAVEFAIVLALLLVPVLFGCWEIGCMIEAQQLMQNAAREGARAAASGSQDNAKVRDIVLKYLQNADIPTANAAITIENVTSGGDVGSATQFDRIRVTVTIPYVDFRWATVTRITSPTHVTAQANWYSLKDRDFPSLGEPAIE